MNSTRGPFADCLITSILAFILVCPGALKVAGVFSERK